MTMRTPKFLDDLTDGVVDLHEIARRRGFTRRQMARWIERPRAAAALDAVAVLADRRAALLLATGRAEAVRALVALATASDGRDLARKACNDLIKLSRGPDAALPPGAPAPAGGCDDPHGDKAFEALARLVEEDEARLAAGDAE